MMWDLNPRRPKPRDLKPRPFDRSGNHAFLFEKDNALGQF